MLLLLEIEGLSIPMSGWEGEPMDDVTGDTCGRGGEGSMDEEDCDTCRGDGGGGGWGLVDKEVCDTHGGD